jgi:hypothetical protein
LPPPNTRVQRTRALASLGSLTSFARSPLTRRLLGGRRAPRVAGALICLLGVGCLGACSRSPRWGSPELNTQLVKLRAANRCDDAIALLLAAQGERNVRWYEWLVDFEGDCFVKTAQQNYKVSAEHFVDDGVRRFPTSSRLLFVKAFMYERFNEHGLALRYYQDALQLARRNIAADKDGLDTADDRAVVANVEANLGVESSGTR